MFTRRHFIAIAEVLYQERIHGVGGSAVEAIAESLADMFETDNRAFDRQKFMAATNGYGNVRN